MLRVSYTLKDKDKDKEKDMKKEWLIIFLKVS